MFSNSIEGVSRASPVVLVRFSGFSKLLDISRNAPQSHRLFTLVPKEVIIFSPSFHNTGKNQTCRYSPPFSGGRNPARAGRNAAFYFPRRVRMVWWCVKSAALYAFLLEL